MRILSFVFATIAALTLLGPAAKADSFVISYGAQARRPRTARSWPAPLSLAPRRLTAKRQASAALPRIMVLARHHRYLLLRRFDIRAD